jgi:hypothetical protein
MDLKKMLRDIRWIGYDTALAALLYSIRRDLINRKNPKEIPSQIEMPTGVVNTTRLFKQIVIQRREK